MKGQNLDLRSGEPPENAKPASGKGLSGRRYIGVKFECCDVYTRVYINREETAYEGRCPKCGKRVTFRVGPNGSDARFFTAS